MMIRRRFFHLGWILAVLVTSGCGGRDAAPGRPDQNSEIVRPDDIRDFAVLYKENCSGCHGVNGKGGAAIGIGDPVYLAIADDATITRIASDGVGGTPMPAFAQRSGGALTDDQIRALVRGIRAHWSNSDVLQGTMPPPYTPSTPGDPKHGAEVYAAFCSSCHGADGRGGKQAGSIVDRAYLTLVSDQNLRTTVIVGRPEWSAPDWRGDIPGKPMSPDEVSDVVAWLSSQRPQLPDQILTSLQAQGEKR